MKTVQGSLLTVDFGPNRAAIMTQMQEALLPPADSIQMDVEETPNTWKAQFRSTVGDIIKPDQISWMDDDHDLPDEIYVQRAFDDIKARFER